MKRIEVDLKLKQKNGVCTLLNAPMNIYHLHLMFWAQALLQT